MVATHEPKQRPFPSISPLQLLAREAVRLIHPAPSATDLGYGLALMANLCRHEPALMQEWLDIHCARSGENPDHPESVDACSELVRRVRERLEAAS